MTRTVSDSNGPVSAARRRAAASLRALSLSDSDSDTTQSHGRGGLSPVYGTTSRRTAAASESLESES